MSEPRYSLQCGNVSAFVEYSRRYETFLDLQPETQFDKLMFSGVKLALTNGVNAKVLNDWTFKQLFLIKDEIEHNSIDPAISQTLETVSRLKIQSELYFNLLANTGKDPS